MNTNASASAVPSANIVVATSFPRDMSWMMRGTLYQDMSNAITNNTMDNEQKYIAKKAILEALLNGRHLSQMDCREFQIEDMRTPISHLKNHFQDTHELRTEWIVTPVRKARIKSYWLEKKQ